MSSLAQHWIPTSRSLDLTGGKGGYRPGLAPQILSFAMASFN